MFVTIIKRILTEAFIKCVCIRGERAEFLEVFCERVNCTEIIGTKESIEVLPDVVTIGTLVS